MKSKVLIILATAALIFVGCKSGDNMAANNKKYQAWVKNNPDCQDGNCFMINGRIDDTIFNGRMIYLSVCKFGVVADRVFYPLSSDIDSVTLKKMNYVTNALQPIDSCIVTNQTFSFKGNLAEPQRASIETENIGENRASLYINLILEPGSATVQITHADSTDFVGGTFYNDKLQAFQNKRISEKWEVNKKYESELKRINEIENLIASGSKTIDDFDTAEINLLEVKLGKMNGEIYKKEISLLWSFYNENKQNLLSMFAIDELRDSDDKFNNKSFVDSLALTASANTKDLLKMISLSIEIREEQEARLKKIQEGTSEGKKYINVNGICKIKESDVWKESSGSLKDLIDGKIAVVDFWASWCGPCRREIKETLLGLHEKYKDQGVVVVGLDVWDEIQAHARAVEQLEISYPQLIDTTKFSSNAYGVEDIPAIFVIAPDGTILGRDLHGKMIEETVLKALKKEE